MMKRNGISVFKSIEEDKKGDYLILRKEGKKIFATAVNKEESGNKNGAACMEKDEKSFASLIINGGKQKGISVFRDHVVFKIPLKDASGAVVKTHCVKINRKELIADLA